MRLRCLKVKAIRWTGKAVQKYDTTSSKEPKDEFSMCPVDYSTG